jgi:Flp pilus assembly protein TadD
MERGARKTSIASLLALAIATASLAHAAEQKKRVPPAETAVSAEEQAVLDSALPEAVKAERIVLRKPNDRAARVKAAKERLAQGADNSENVDAAHAHALAVLAEHPTDVESLLLAGQTSLLKNDVTTAARYYRAATLAAPNNDSAFLGLGNALMRMGDEPGSSAAFARYRSLMGMEPVPAEQPAK